LLPPEPVIAAGSIAVSAPAGSAILFDSMLFHRAGANASIEARRAAGEGLGKRPNYLFYPDGGAKSDFFRSAANNPLPSFLRLSSGYGLLFSFVWSQLGNAPINAIVRSFFNMSPEQYDALNFGAPDSNKTAVQAIYH
jgi:hypothetical protein